MAAESKRETVLLTIARVALVLFVAAMVVGAVLTYSVLEAGTLEQAAQGGHRLAVATHLRFLRPSAAERDMALQLAVFYDRPGVFETLLANEPEAIALSNGLVIALLNRRVEMAEALLRAGADPNAPGVAFTVAPPTPMTPLQAATEHGDESLTPLLRQWGAE